MSDVRTRARRRRWALALLTLGTAAVATTFFASILQRDGTVPLDIPVIALYAILSTWLALGLWMSLFGFGVQVARRLSPPAPFQDTPLEGRTAIVMPVYNEATAPVFARLRAILATIDEAGQGHAFDVFILSDTRDPEIWLAEEAAWAALRRDEGARSRVFYRRRLRNTGRKSGNVADFLERWGPRYAYMLVLDADSIMDGATIVELARRMDSNRRVALIQVPPQPVRGETLAARAQEFASSLFGPMASSGLAFVSQDDGNFWGHNAIIRIEPFIDNCALPRLAGEPPLGGEILSHDFVEAALLLRAGWEVWMADDLGGSYEESPPTIIDFAKRDRRWCQGNLQHFKLIFERSFHPMSRFYFAMGIMAYCSSLVWLLFLIAGGAELAWRIAEEPIYFVGNNRMPIWPISVEGEALVLLIATLLALFLPKILGYLLAVTSARLRRGYGGFVRLTLSLLLESVYTTLLAPIMMLFHSGGVISILTGRAVGWGPQRRGVKGSVLMEMVQVHTPHTLLGLVVAGAVLTFAPDIFWWMSPILFGLILSLPISLLAGDPRVGLWLKRAGILLTPEEKTPPKVVAMVDGVDEEDPPMRASRFGLAMVDPAMNALHAGLVRSFGDVPVRDRAELDAIEAKAVEHGIETLTRDERVAVLEDPDLTERVHQKVWRAWSAAHNMAVQ